MDQDDSSDAGRQGPEVDIAIGLMAEEAKNQVEEPGTTRLPHQGGEDAGRYSDNTNFRTHGADPSARGAPSEPKASSRSTNLTPRPMPVLVILIPPPGPSNSGVLLVPKVTPVTNLQQIQGAPKLTITWDESTAARDSNPDAAFHSATVHLTSIDRSGHGRWVKDPQRLVAAVFV